MQDANNFYAKSWKVAELYNELGFNDVFIREVDSSICYKHREYWATHLQANVNTISLKAQIFLAIQKLLLTQSLFCIHVETKNVFLAETKTNYWEVPKKEKHFSFRYPIKATWHIIVDQNRLHLLL